MYQIMQISKYNNMITYGYGQRWCFIRFSWYAMSPNENLNMIDFVRTD